MKRKILFNSLLILAGAGIGLAIGVALRGNPGTQREPAVLSQAAPVNATRVSRRQTAIRLNDDSPLTTKLERDLSMSAGVTRWLHWLAALEKAGPADFPRLMRLAQTDSTAKGFVAARWVEVAPRHLFDLIVGLSKNTYGLSIDELA